MIWNTIIIITSSNIIRIHTQLINIRWSTWNLSTWHTTSFSCTLVWTDGTITRINRGKWTTFMTSGYIYLYIYISGHTYNYLGSWDNQYSDVDWIKPLPQLAPVGQGVHATNQRIHSYHNTEKTSHQLKPKHPTQTEDSTRISQWKHQYTQNKIHTSHQHTEHKVNMII